jgi:hypothetical protein
MGIERLTLSVALACVAGCSTPPATPDLATYLERRAMCDHMRGEFPDPPDAERMHDIMAQVDQFCPGSDAQLAQLKARYRDDAAVSKELDALDPHIESTRK